MKSSEGGGGCEEDALRPFAVPPGLVLLAVKDRELVPHVQRIVERVVSTGKSQLGVTLERPKPVVSMRATSRRGFETELRMAALAKTGEVLLKHVSDDEEFQWLAVEGGALLAPELASVGSKWVSVAVPVTTVGDTAFTCLERLRGQAKKARSHLLIFAVGTDERNREETLAGMQKHADDVAFVERCEAEPGSLLAFSIKWRGMEHLEALGQRGVMCSVGQKDGRFRAKFNAFIHQDLHTRFMWMLACEGESLRSIGELLGLNKSTVLRRIADLPPRRPLLLEAGWQKAYLAVSKLSEDDS